MVGHYSLKTPEEILLESQMKKNQKRLSIGLKTNLNNYKKTDNTTKNKAIFDGPLRTVENRPVPTIVGEEKHLHYTMPGKSEHDMIRVGKRSLSLSFITINININIITNIIIISFSLYISTSYLISINDDMLYPLELVSAIRRGDYSYEFHCRCRVSHCGRSNREHQPIESVMALVLQVRNNLIYYSIYIYNNIYIYNLYLLFLSISIIYIYNLYLFLYL